MGRNVLPKSMKRSQKERWCDGTHCQTIWRDLIRKGGGTEHTTTEYEEISKGKVVGRNILPKNMKRSQKERRWAGTYYQRIWRDLRRKGGGTEHTYYQTIWRDLIRKGGGTEHTNHEYEEISEGKVVGRNILPKNMKRSQKERQHVVFMERHKIY
jgi:hypothetical protein